VIGAGARPLWRISSCDRETGTRRRAPPVDGEVADPYIGLVLGTAGLSFRRSGDDEA
jgi:hypothetical protein